MPAAYKAEIVRDRESGQRRRKVIPLESADFPTFKAAMEWLASRLSRTFSGYVYERGTSGDWESVVDWHM